jgi:hypothetical protein
MSPSVLLKMRNISEKNIVQKIKKKQGLYSVIFFKSLAVYEIMWKNLIEADRSQMTIRSMRTVC